MKKKNREEREINKLTSQQHKRTQLIIFFSI
jgi:hypothetical protein